MDHADGHNPSADNIHIACWSGELLFPINLPSGDIIDLSHVTALGTWTYAWFRNHPHCAITGATPSIRKQINRAHLPVVWTDLPTHGVGPAERAALLDEE
jgi:hypothetical protein